MALTLSLNTNPLVNRFAEPDDLSFGLISGIDGAILGSLAVGRSANDRYEVALLHLLVDKLL
jgi:hypothetical protein